MTSSDSTPGPSRPWPGPGRPIPGPAAPLLRAHPVQADDQVILTLTGDIDLTTAGTVRAAARRCLRERPARLLLDMRAVSFCDVAGVRALQWARREAAAIPAEFGIIAPRRQVMRVFTLMDAGDLLCATQGPPQQPAPAHHADARDCEQCGAAFKPRREHDRFCSAGCRIAWNQARGRQARDTALGWSVTAMADATQRLGSAGTLEMPQALAVISEAVWWVTIVDATMIRYHPGAYDHALAALDPAERRAAEGTFAGLRFVRNQLGYHADPADFIQSQPGTTGSGDAPTAAWTWEPVPAPELRPVPPRGRTWEISRYQQYRKHLAGHPVGDTIGRAAAFLTQVHAAAGRAAEASGRTAP
jgi:anti-anti-sigma factor